MAFSTEKNNINLENNKDRARETENNERLSSKYFSHFFSTQILSSTAVAQLDVIQLIVMIMGTDGIGATYLFNQSLLQSRVHHEHVGHQLTVVFTA